METGTVAIVPQRLGTDVGCFVPLSLRCPSGRRSVEHEPPNSLWNKASKVQTFNLRVSACGDQAIKLESNQIL